VTAFASGAPIDGKRRILTRTYHEYILRLICRVSFEMREIINTCYYLNSETVYSNFKDLILIPPCLARATGTAASPVELENPCGSRRCQQVLRRPD
jgi:hypothetical protein